MDRPTPLALHLLVAALAVLAATSAAQSAGAANATTTVVPTSTVATSLLPLPTPIASDARTVSPLVVRIAMSIVTRPMTALNNYSVISILADPSIAGTVTRRLQQDLAAFMNLESTSVSLTQVTAQSRDSTLRTTATFARVTNTSAAVARLQYYVAPSRAAPDALFPNFGFVVFTTTYGGDFSVTGIVFAAADVVDTSVSDPLCFFTPCLGAHIVVVAAAIAAFALVVYVLKKRFDAWAENAPSRERAFDQSSNRRQGDDATEMSYADVAAAARRDAATLQRQRAAAGPAQRLAGEDDFL